LSFKICVISGVHQKASGRVACRKSLALLIVTLVSESASIERELWTATDFLDWLQPGVHADLIDGEEFMHSPGSLKNARLTNFLDHLLRSWLERTTFGGELHREMVAVRLDSRNVFLPDLCWFDAEQKARLPETHAPFAPRWVCEVLSPRTADRDTGPKFSAYETSGVREYWLLDPETLAHRFYFRSVEGEYLEEFARGENWIASRVLEGFRVSREWLRPEALQNVSACLDAISSRPA
jgi:Uma2 family endonuclease